MITISQEEYDGLKECDRREKEYERLEKEYNRLTFNQSLSSFKTLLSLGEGKLKLQNKGIDLSHTNNNHTEATVEKEVDIQLPKLEDEDVAACAAPSALLCEFVDFSESIQVQEIRFKKQEQGNEGDVCAFVRAAVNDAIALFQHLHYKKFMEKELTEIDMSVQRSLLSCRPDIIDVYTHVHDIPILSIIFKKPLLRSHLTDERKALGQVFDQSEVVQAFYGPGSGLCVLSTYNESIICWPSESNIGGELLQPTAAVAETTVLPAAVGGSSQGLTQSRPRMTTPKPTSHGYIPATVPPVSESPPEESNSPEGSNGTFTLGQERKLSCSQPFKPNCLVHLLYTAIMHAYKKRSTIKREIWNLEKNKLYCFPKALRLVDQEKFSKSDKARVETKYEWGRLEFQLGQPIIGIQPDPDAGEHSKMSKTMHDPEKNMVFYVIGILGDGATSRVFHAVDSNGEQVAIKLYIKREDNANIESEDDESDDNEKTESTMSKNEFDKIAKDAAMREANQLTEQYAVLEGKVSTATFFEKMHAVVMPVFTPVEKDHRMEALEPIRRVLQELAGRGFKYADDDICWRHVGRYKDKEGKEHYVLFDLADLEEISDPSEHTIENHIDELKKRTGFDESSVSGQGFIGFTQEASET